MALSNYYRTNMRANYFPRENEDYAEFQLGKSTIEKKSMLHAIILGGAQ